MEALGLGKRQLDIPAMRVFRMSVSADEAFVALRIDGSTCAVYTLCPWNQIYFHVDYCEGEIYDFVWTTTCAPNRLIVMLEGILIEAWDVNDKEGDEHKRYAFEDPRGEKVVLCMDTRDDALAVLTGTCNDFEEWCVQLFVLSLETTAQVCSVMSPEPMGAAEYEDYESKCIVSCIASNQVAVAWPARKRAQNCISVYGATTGVLLRSVTLPILVHHMHAFLVMGETPEGARAVAMLPSNGGDVFATCADMTFPVHVGKQRTFVVCDTTRLEVWAQPGTPLPVPSTVDAIWGHPHPFQ